MRICVLCRPGRDCSDEPYVFHLGAHRLPVVAVLDRWRDEDLRYYTVSVSDGRRFVLCHRMAADAWELVAVYRPAGKSTSRARSAIGSGIARPPRARPA